VSDRIDELVDEIGAGWQDCPFCGQRPRYRGIRPVISWDVESDGPTCDAPWHALRPGEALTELATIARDNAAEADKWRKVAEAGEPGSIKLQPRPKREKEEGRSRPHRRQRTRTVSGGGVDGSIDRLEADLTAAREALRSEGSDTASE